MLDDLEERINDRTARGLAQAVSEAIRDGAIAGHQQLPPIRELASRVGMSPSTVASAWSILARAGLIYTDGRRGTRVAERYPSGPARFRRTLNYSAAFEVNLSAGLPDPELLPDIQPSLMRLHEAGPLQTYLPQPVLPELQDHLHTNWPYAADMITVADGVMDALDLITVTFLRFGDHVAIEEVTDPLIIDLLEASGVVVAPVTLDGEGPVPDSLRMALAAGARTVIFQPRAQKPSGLSISAKRAQALAEEISAADARLFEIDFAGEIASGSLISLGSLIPGNTTHIRGYSTPYGPDLRLAAIGGPSNVMSALIERRHLGQGWTSRLLQTLLLDLLRDRKCQSQLQRARETYALRRAALTNSLADHGVAGVTGDGLNLWVPVANEAAALISLTSQGIGTAPGSPFAVSEGADPHLCVTAAVCPVEIAARIGEALASAALPAPISSTSVRRAHTKSLE